MFKNFWFVCLIVWIAVLAVGASNSAGTLPKILILQPVNLKSGRVSPKLGAEFRSLFERQEKWQVISGEAMRKTFEEYKQDYNTPCKELSCAFDAGGIFQSQYTLYSTITIFENYYIFSLNLVDQSLTKVVWSENGEILIKSGKYAEEALLHRLQQLVKKLDPKKIRYQTVSSKGTLGILNMSPNTEFSRILFERLSTHAYTSGLYDLVGKTELEFILESHDINTTSITPVIEDILPLGQKLGIDFLIYAMIKKERAEYYLNLGLFDIKNKERVRMWPYKSKNFRKLLQFEETFFSNLIKHDPFQRRKQKSQKSKLWKKLLLPASLAAGGTSFYLSLSAFRSADSYYDKFHNANTLQEIAKRPHFKSQSQKQRRKGYVFTSIGIFFILSGGIVLFQF